MTAWVNFGSFSTDKMTPILMKHHNNVVEDGSVWITVSTGGLFQFTIDEASTGNDRCYSTTAVVADVWYHLAAVKSGTSMKLYVNGVEECSITQITTPNIGGGDINIGSSPGFDHGTYFYEFVENLKIDEVTIWTKALSATEVSDMQIKAVDPSINRPRVLITVLTNLKIAFSSVTTPAMLTLPRQIGMTIVVSAATHLSLG